MSNKKDNQAEDNDFGITEDELNEIDTEFANEMNKLDEKRKKSKNIKKHILSFFRTKIYSFYFPYSYYLGDGIDFENVEWEYDDKWVPENDDELGQISNKIYDFLYDYFNPPNYFNTDGYCILQYENNKLLFTIEEDTENAVEFDFDKMQHIEKEFPEDYKPLLIKWEITDEGIVEILK